VRCGDIGVLVLSWKSTNNNRSVLEPSQKVLFRLCHPLLYFIRRFQRAAVNLMLSVLGDPLQNSIRIQDSEFALKSIHLFCVNHQCKSLNDQISHIIPPSNDTFTTTIVSELIWAELSIATIPVHLMLIPIPAKRRFPIKAFRFESNLGLRNRLWSDGPR
jgi:hypothetical protein